MSAPDPRRIDSLACVVLVALDDLEALIDADPAAAFANRAVRQTADTLRHDWLPALRRIRLAPRSAPSA